MAHKLTLTRKYQIIERRVDDEDELNELTDDATLKAFNALKEMGLLRANSIFSDRVGDFQYDDFIFYFSDAQFAVLKESDALDGFEIEELDD